MATMAISVFKAHALQVVGKVARSKESLVITKRGMPLVQVIPYQPMVTTLAPGRLSSTLVFEKDIVTPLGEGIWEAAR